MGTGGKNTFRDPYWFENIKEILRIWVYVNMLLFETQAFSGFPGLGDERRCIDPNISDRICISEGIMGLGDKRRCIDPNVNVRVCVLERF